MGSPKTRAGGLTQLVPSKTQKIRLLPNEATSQGMPSLSGGTKTDTKSPEMACENLLPQPRFSVWMNEIVLGSQVQNRN